MNHLPVIVVGAGGHGLVVADALLCAGRRVIGFVDPDPALRGHAPLGLPLIGDDAALAAHDRAGVVLANGIGGVGDGSDLRRRLQQRLAADGWVFCTVTHPSALISPHAGLMDGAQVLAGAVVQAMARVGPGAIVNTRAVVEHHAVVGAFAHVAPGAVLCGRVEIGARSHVGAGAVVRQGVTLGDGVVVGIGAAVLKDVAAGVVAGVPARSLGKRS